MPTVSSGEFAAVCVMSGVLFVIAVVTCCLFLRKADEVRRKDQALDELLNQAAAEGYDDGDKSSFRSPRSGMPSAPNFTAAACAEATSPLLVQTTEVPTTDSDKQPTPFKVGDMVEVRYGEPMGSAAQPHGGQRGQVTNMSATGSVVVRFDSGHEVQLPATSLRIVRSPPSRSSSMRLQHGQTMTGTVHPLHPAPGTAVPVSSHSGDNSSSFASNLGRGGPARVNPFPISSSQSRGCFFSGTEREVQLRERIARLEGERSTLQLLNPSTPDSIRSAVPPFLPSPIGRGAEGSQSSGIRAPSPPNHGEYTALSSGLEVEPTFSTREQELRSWIARLSLQNRALRTALRPQGGNVKYA